MKIRLQKACQADISLECGGLAPLFIWLISITPVQVKRRQAAALQGVVFVFLTIAFVGGTQAQSTAIRAHIAVNSTDPGKVRVELRLPELADRLSFRNFYGSVVGLGQRIGNVRAGVDPPQNVSVLAPGEYSIPEKATRFDYEVDLTEPARLEDRSHVSWLNSERGLLMLTDLLPRLADSKERQPITISVSLPPAWKMISNAAGNAIEFSTSTPEQTVILVARDILQTTKAVSSTNLTVTATGEWSTKSSDLAKAAARILEEYSKLTGFTLTNNPQVMVIPFPVDAGPERWSAETRGNTVVLLLANRRDSKQLLRRISLLLSHELFHLWVPNSLTLEGDYDWFFEGFTIYQSLLTDVRLGYISFNQFLDTISRVYQSFLSAPDRNRLSLLEASERRWTTSPSLIYDKGLLVAFVYDLIVRSKTNCGAAVRDVYPELFRSRATGQQAANETIIRLLKGPETESLIRNHVESHVEFDFPGMISKYGLVFDQGRVKPGSSLTESQRKLLKCFGY